MRSHRLVLPLILILALSCRGAEQAPDRRTLIDSRDREDPRSLDPALTTDVPTGRAVAYLFDGLTRFAPDGSLEPGLAARWDVSEDGRRYVFHLRQGVRFHDGTPFRASQVVRSFHRVLESATRGGRPWPLYPIAGARSYAEGRARSVTGLTAVNDSTLEITLDTALAIFPKLMAMPVASVVPDSVPPDFGERPVGTGPWKLVEWRHDDYLLFARNDAYFDGPPKADSLMARIIPEPSTAVAEFEAGNVDVLYVPEAETPQWQADPARRALLASAPALRLWYVAINTKRGPLSDARVRRALNHAIDVRTILERLIGGRGTLSAGVIPPGLEGFDSTRTPYAFDQARARQLLAEAGHAGGVDMEIWHSQVPVFAQVAQSIQAYLGQVNVRARIVQRDAPSVREASRNGQVDLIVKDWFADYPDAENFLYPLLHSANHGVGGNVSFYSNPTFDQIVSRARVEQDAARRATLYRQADSLAFEGAPMVYLFFYNDLLAMQPWVQGFRVPAIFTGQRWTDVSLSPPR